MEERETRAKQTNSFHHLISKLCHGMGEFSIQSVLTGALCCVGLSYQIEDRNDVLSRSRNFFDIKAAISQNIILYTLEIFFCER